MNMKNKLFVAFLLTWSTFTLASINVPVHLIGKEGKTKPVGNITIQETSYGLLFTPHLKNLTPGVHGFHIHQNPSCEKEGMAAGGHLDPKHTNRHRGPYNNQGHLGDLPALYVNKNGRATLPVLAPRLKSIQEIKGHSLMIHEGGDTYSDVPQKLGGGGGRMVCGVITK